MSKYDIAIVGMGCVFPEANNTEEYWDNILSGKEFVKDMPEHLWPMKQYWSEERKDHKASTIKGSFLKDFDFNPIEYHIPPKSLEGVDRAQLVAMEATRQALKDAGVAPKSKELEEAVTVIGASGVDEFAHVALYLDRQKFFREFGPRLNAAGLSQAEQDELFEEFSKSLQDRGHHFHPSVTAVGAVASSLSNRVAQVFGVKGFNMSVDGACASSFVALSVASHALMAGDARMAIAGGVDLGINPAIYVGFSRLGGLSPDGKTNPFDNSANGLVIGEGGGVVILKRLEDAIADGDSIKAVIRGIGTTSDGAGQAIYNPSDVQRTLALKKGLESAELAAEKVQFLEAHATSTVVGDANEYDAIEGAYGDRDPSNPLYLGTVKHQIGHLKAGAGVAGLIKTVLAMQNKKIPHMPRFKKLSEQAKKKNDALVVNTKVLPWEPREDGSRYASVTASGFGGVNYHVVLEEAEKYTVSDRTMPSRDMALVGVVNRLPGAVTPEEFFSNALCQKNNFKDIDPEALGWEMNVDSGPENERIGTRKIALIDDFDLDYMRLKISPKSVSQTSPAQILAAELSDKLLTQCGYELKEAKNIGVSIGAMHDDNYATITYPMNADEYATAMRQTKTFKKHAPKLEKGLQDTVDAVVAAGPPSTEATLPGWMSNVNAGIVANRLNCRGPNFTVDTACSSGVASFLPAMYQMMFTDLDAIITGGLNRHTTSVFATSVDAIGAIARDTPRPFDKDGAGFIAGEGGILFLMKRLEDAKKAGDPIHGIIRNVAGSSEYKSKSMVAPTEEALRHAIEEGMKHVSLKPEELGVVDTHGSANRLSDIAEAHAIANVLRPKGATEAPVHITAVKSHVGHVYGGSGSAGILSVLNSLNSGMVPGIRNLNTYRPEIEEVLDRAKPQKGTGPLEETFTSGGVTSLGLGGSNYFAVVSAGDESVRKAAKNMAAKASSLEAASLSISSDSNSAGASVDGVFSIKGRNHSDIRASVDAYLEFGNHVSDESANLVLSVSYDTEPTLKNKLSTVKKFMDSNADLKPLELQGVYLYDRNRGSEKFAFAFPGQGTHYVGMGRFLYETRPEFKAVIDTVHRLAMDDLNFDLLADLYGDIDKEEAARLLSGLDGAQISLFAVEVGLAKVFESIGIVPDVMVGHSFGEISALAAQDVWDLDVAYRVVAARIRAAKDGGKGHTLKMMSIICDDAQKDALLSLAGDEVVLSNINAPGQFIFAGIEKTILKVADTAKTLGLESRILEIGSAFHSKFMEDAVEPFRKALAELPSRQPKVPIMSTITNDYVTFSNSEELAKHLSLQLTTKLDMPTVITKLHNDGVRNFLEVGPKWAVTKLIDAILKDKDYKAVPSLHPKIGDEETFRRALAYMSGLGKLGGSAGAPTGSEPFSLEGAFMAYLRNQEPAIISLLNEAHKRYSGNSSTGFAVAGALSASAPSVSAGPAVARKTAEALKPPASAVPAPAAAIAAPTSGADLSQWVSRSKAMLAETTGYPEEMLGEELDLEADLGIDSVQRAEIWGKLVGEFGLDPEARPESIKSINELAAELAKISGGPASAAAPAPAAGAVPSAGGADLGEWVSRSKSMLAETTGYPEEMLGEELDLEADLGIDSVQRAEIWGKLVGEFGLDPEARPESIKSINELAAELAKIAGGSAAAAASTPAAGIAAPVPGAPAAGGDLSEWAARSKAMLAEATGYPEEMLGEDLDLEADLGIDSVQRAEIWGKLVGEFGLDPEARPESIKSINELAAELAKIAGGSAAAAAPAPTSVTATPAASAAAAGGDLSEWAARSKAMLAEATGYPEEMLGEDLDLEADLGIDSVQRAEIWGKLVGEFGLDPEARPESIKSINELAAELAKLAGGGSSSAGEPSQAVQTAGTAAVPANEETINRLFYSGHLPVSQSEKESFNCKSTLVIVSDAKSEKAWSEGLIAPETTISVVKAADLLKSGNDEISKRVSQADTIVVASYDKVTTSKAKGSKLSNLILKETKTLYSLFRAMAPALRDSETRIICPIAQDGAFGAEGQSFSSQGAFPAGFLRSLSYEIPQARFQIIDAGSQKWMDVIEKLLPLAFPFPEVGLLNGEWIKPSLMSMAPVSEEQTPLDKGDLVLVTGGARGIVFECVRELAKRTGCRLLLTGRTQPAAGNEEWLKAAPETIDQTMRELEMSLVKEGSMNLGEAKRFSAKCRSQWEVNRNLDLLKADGTEASYETCDVSDKESLQSLLDGLGDALAVQGVVHGAGVQRSKLFEELADDAIALTLNTKMVPLFLLEELLDFSKIKLFSAFGSIAGLFGNAGQSDYSLANDMLASAVTDLGLRNGIFAQTVEWTAWKGTGMVTDAESKRFEEAGLYPVGVADGVKLYIDAVLGSSLPRLAAFNRGAAFAGRRNLSHFAVSPQPRKSLKEGEGNTIVFNLSRDVYINQHLVRHNPVVPGTFTTEILSECKSDTKKVLKDVSFRRPVWVRDGELEIEVVEDSGRMLVLPKDRPALEGQALGNLSFASAATGAPKKVAKKNLLAAPKTIITELKKAAETTENSFYSKLDAQFSDSLITGPVFRGVRSTIEKDGLFYGLLNLTDDARRSFAIPGDFVINPVVADMAIQAAAAWGMLRHDVMAIPFGIEELRVYAPTTSREAVAVCREIEITPEEAKMDIVVRELDGTVVFTMDGVVLKTISGE